MGQKVVTAPKWNSDKRQTRTNVCRSISDSDVNPWQNADTRHFKISTSDLGSPWQGFFSGLVYIRLNKFQELIEEYHVLCTVTLTTFKKLTQVSLNQFRRFFRCVPDKSYFVFQSMLQSSDLNNLCPNSEKLISNCNLICLLLFQMQIYDCT